MELYLSALVFLHFVHDVFFISDASMFVIPHYCLILDFLNRGGTLPAGKLFPDIFWVNINYIPDPYPGAGEPALRRFQSVAGGTA